MFFGLKGRGILFTKDSGEQENLKADMGNEKSIKNHNLAT